MERRKYSRIPLQVNAQLVLPDGHTVGGMTRDVSFGGAQLVCAPNLPLEPGAECTLKLLLQTSPEILGIELRCTVVETGEGRIGLRFVAIDVDNYQDFKNLMINHSPEPAKLLEELDRYPGLAVGAETA